VGQTSSQYFIRALRKIFRQSDDASRTTGGSLRNSKPAGEWVNENLVTVPRVEAGKDEAAEIAKMDFAYHLICASPPEWEPGYLSGIALSCGLDDREFESRQELGIFLFTTASRLALGPTQLPNQWAPEALSWG
jgi:hypothetical protein